MYARLTRAPPPPGQASGDLTGLLDERGKYIFTSRDELAKVAGFILKKGRVSVAELAAAANSIIDFSTI